MTLIVITDSNHRFKNKNHLKIRKKETITAPLQIFGQNPQNTYAIIPAMAKFIKARNIRYFHPKFNT